MLITLPSYLSDNLPGGELGSVITDIAEAGKQIAHAVQRSGLLDLHGAVGGQNVHGEHVQKLDEHSNEIMKEILGANPAIIGMASEEEESVVDVADGKGQGMIVAFDPLDGSTNIDINMPVGTIFSVLPSTGSVAEDFLQPAGKQLLAGYLLYSSSTNLVFSTGSGVQEFTLDPDSGEFVLTNENIKIPRSSGYISYNSAHINGMSPELATAYTRLLEESGLPARYAGAMVGDINRTLLKGGFFGYPAVIKDDKSQAKLRMQYECKPLAWLIEQAGGTALIDGRPIANLRSTSLHQKVSIELGDAAVMKRFKDLLN